MAEKKRPILLLSLITVLTLIVAVLISSYAFFASQTTGKGEANIKAETGTTDVLTFEMGELISIDATLDNFGSGKGNIAQTTNPKATLRANDANFLAKAKYNVYLVLDENDLIFTTESKTPEILVQIFEPNGTEIKKIEGLNYYENVDGQEGVNGFDITHREDAFAIAEGYDIAVEAGDDGIKTQTWKVTVTLVNFQNSGQNANVGHSLSGRILMTNQKEDTYHLAHVNTISTEHTTDSIAATLDVTSGTKEITEYWFGIENKGEVMAAADDVDDFNDYHQSTTGATYTFNNLTDNTNYIIRSYVVDKEGLKSNVYKTEIVATDKYIIPQINMATATATSYDTIEVKVTNATDGTNVITKYRYQIEANGKVIADKTVTKQETTHIFTGLTELTQYKIIINAIDSKNRESTNYELNPTTLKKTIGKVCKNQIFASCAITNYQLDNTIIYHNTTALANTNIANKTLSANDSSYRYSGASNIVDNFVCLDGTSTSGKCQNGDNDLYRIIGIFKNGYSESEDSGNYEIKLIKYDYVTSNQLGNSAAYLGNYSQTKDNYKGSNGDNVTSYYWNTTNSSNSNSMWKESNFNKTNLNTYYLNTYLAKVNKLATNIVPHYWEVGGVPENSNFTPQMEYNNEIGSAKSTKKMYCYNTGSNTTKRTCNTTDDIVYQAKIGLMYLSDYGYAAYATAWNTALYNYTETIRNNNWMFMGLYEWTISRYSDYNKYAWDINNVGKPAPYDVDHAITARPSFYLISTVKLSSGEGTYDNPYRLTLS